MNKKGFTLTELLATIVILSVVMLIGSVSVSGIRNKMNKNMFESKLDFVISSAKSWGQDNKELFTSSNSYQLNKTVGFLVGETYLETEDRVPQTLYASCETKNKIGTDCRVVLNPMDDSVVNGLKLKIYLQYNRVYACIVKDSNNQTILKETASWTEYKDLNYYCS